MYYAIETRQGGIIKITTGHAVNSNRRELGTRNYAAADLRRREIQAAFPDRPVVVVQFPSDEAAIEYCASYN